MALRSPNFTNNITDTYFLTVYKGGEIIMELGIDHTLIETAAVPIVVGLVSIIKQSGIPHKFAPILSLLLGVGVSYLIHPLVDVRALLLEGITFGLSASGLYSGVKVLVNPETREDTTTHKH